ncbi:hypothetical protein ACQEU3_37555 [Spirillospora sp. CA-253888]
MAGAALVAGAMVGLLLVFEWGGRTRAWASGVILLLLGAVAVLAALFVWRERRAPHPLVPLRLFTDPVLRVVLPATALLGALLGGSIVYLPTFLQAAYGMGAARAGLALNPYVLTFMTVSSLAGARIGARGRFKPSLVAGAAVAVLGFGLLMQNLVVIAQNAVAPADLAATTSATVSVRGLGLSLGVAVFGSLLNRELQGRPPGPTATAEAIPDVLLAGVPAAIVLVALMAALPRTVDRPVPS